MVVKKETEGDRVIMGAKVVGKLGAEGVRVW